MANPHIEPNTRSIVRIQSYVSDFHFQLPHIGQAQGEASGTGFIIDSSVGATTGVERLLIMTAAHVVSTAHRFTIRFPSLGAKEIETENLILIPAYDLAVFQVTLDRKRDPSLAALQTSVMRLITEEELNTLPQGSAVQAYGFPKGLANVKVTTGSFNGLERNELQHDAATSPGSSGGPVVSVHLNAVIGVVSWKMVGHGVEGMHFTMPVSLWRLVLQRIAARVDSLTTTPSGARIMKAPLFGFCVQRVTGDLTLAQACVRDRNSVELEIARDAMAQKAAIAVEKYLSPFANASPDVWQELHKALQHVVARTKAATPDASASDPSAPDAPASDPSAPDAPASAPSAPDVPTSDPEAPGVPDAPASAPSAPDATPASAPEASGAPASTPTPSHPRRAVKSRSQREADAAAAAIEAGLVARMRAVWERKLRLQKEAATPHATTTKRAEGAQAAIRQARGSAASAATTTIWGGSLDVCHGARVSDVVTGSPAWRAGMRAGDVLGAIDDYPVNGRGEIMGAPWAQGQMVSVSEFMFRAIEPRDYVFTVWRGNERLRLAMTAEPARNSLLTVHPPFEHPSFMVLDGLVVMTSNANLIQSGISFALMQMSRNDLFRRTFVVVVHVIRGSRAAAHSSLNRGSLVHMVGGHPVSTVEDIADVLRAPLRRAATTRSARDVVVNIEGGDSPGMKVVFSTTCRDILRAAFQMRQHMQIPSNVFAFPVIAPV